jgi:hypothetical protein
VIKSSRMSWPGHATFVTKKRMAYSVWRRNIMERDYLVDLGIDGGLT